MVQDRRIGVRQSGSPLLSIGGQEVVAGALFRGRRGSAASGVRVREWLIQNGRWAGQLTGVLERSILALEMNGEPLPAIHP